MLFQRHDTLPAYTADPCDDTRLGWSGVIVFFLQIDTVTQKNSSRDKHLQNRLSRTPCAFGAD